MTNNKTRNKKTRKNKESLFGIDDCNRPKRNTKKLFIFGNRSTSKNRKRIKGGKFNKFILFAHDLGQTKHGVDKAVPYIAKFIKRDKINVKITNDLYKNINALYKANDSFAEKRINVGGDHSMSIATIAHTLNKYPDAKVVYFDAHADINTYKSSKSKHYHGMPLSFVTGLNSDKRFPFIKEKLGFDNLLYIGSRCWDPYEVNEVYKHNIKFLEPDEINKNFKASMEKILSFVGDSPIHVSFDVDSIDPKYIPSTGTPVKNGIELTNGIKILDALNKRNLVNMDITELNMDLGTKNDGIKSGKNTVKLFKHFLD
jgi:arginase